MLDEDEWNSMVSSLKTLFNDEKNIEVWDFMASTFPKDFVDFVDEKIKEREVYSKKKNS
jgi:uncharacterized protein (DUF2164 family)